MMLLRLPSSHARIHILILRSENPGIACKPCIRMYIRRYDIDGAFDGFQCLRTGVKSENMRRFGLGGATGAGQEVSIFLHAVDGRLFCFFRQIGNHHAAG